MNLHLSLCFWSTQPKTFTHSLIVFKFNGHILVLLFEIQLLWCCQKSLLIELLPFFASVIIQFPSFLPISLEFPFFKALSLISLTSLWLSSQNQWGISLVMLSLLFPNRLQDCILSWNVFRKLCHWSGNRVKTPESFLSNGSENDFWVFFLGLFSFAHSLSAMALQRYVLGCLFTPYILIIWFTHLLGLIIIIHVFVTSKFTSHVQISL